MKILVVGAGSIGRRHLGNLAELARAGEAAGDDALQLGIVDADRTRAEAAAATVNATVHADLDTALGDAPDAALVATPTHLHLDHALACARAGAHLFIEKPLAQSLTGVDALAAELLHRDRYAMVGCNLRFDDVYAHVRFLLDEGRLGAVHAAHLHFGYDLVAWRPGVDYRDVYSAHRAQGGGILLDAIHEIDLALSWFGRPERVLSAPRRTGALDGDVEDAADVIVQFASGAVCTLHLNYRDPVYRRTASLGGDQAVVEADFARRTVSLRASAAARSHGSSQAPARAIPRESIDDGDTTVYPADRNTMYVRELAHFLAVVRGGARPATCLDEGRAALEVALAARDGGPVVELPSRFPKIDRVPVVIQARIGSTRLPGKVMKIAAGKTMLAHLVERLRRANKVERVAIATSSAPADRAIVDEAARLGVPCFVGSEQDVLARYVGAARRWDLPAVARITGDCPLLDAATVDFCIERFLAQEADYCTNALPRSVPDGFDVEVMTREALERADRQATEKADREHVTRFFYRHPERFRVRAAAPFDRVLACRRWTLDTPEDFAFLRSVFERLYPTQPDFRLADVLTLLDREPALDTVPRYAV